MTHYPVPTVNDTQGIYEVARFANTASDNILFPIMLLVVWTIGFIGSITEGRVAYKAWTFASFISTILGTMLALMGFLDPKYMYLLVFMTAVGMFWAHLQSNKAS